MEQFSLKAMAKINLALHVLNKRPDGYHDIESLMQLVEFGDDVSLSLTETPEICLTTNAELPTDEGNIAFRAAALMKKTFSIQNGFSIHIEKRIPIAAGLAGGSTNAAAVMHLINKACKLGLTVEELAALGVQLGADVPFCLYGSPALAEGIGEKLTPVAGLKDCYILLLNPGVGVSTAMIYKALDNQEPIPKGQCNQLIEKLSSGDLQGAFLQMKNVMEPAAIQYCPVIKDLLCGLQKAGADHVMMSGSGATCFGIFKEQPDENELRNLFGSHFVALTKPVLQYEGL